MTFTNRRDWQGGRRDEPSLSEVLHVLRGRRLLVAGVVLVLAGFALLFGLFRGPVYTAEAVVSVSPQGELGGDEAREAFVEEVKGAVVTEEMLREVMRRAGWEARTAKFRERLDSPVFVNRDGTSGLRVTFSDSEPGRAVRVANAYAGLFAEKVDGLDGRRFAGGTLAADAGVEQRAATPEGAGARPLVYAAVAAGVGLVIGGGVALLLESRASGWRGVRDAEMALRAPVLGAIPDYSSTKGEG